jgi:hypothetical protein
MTGFSHLLQRAADVLEDPWRIRPTLGTVVGMQPQRQERGGPDAGPDDSPVDN